MRNKCDGDAIQSSDESLRIIVCKTESSNADLKKVTQSLVRSWNGSSHVLSLVRPDRFKSKNDEEVTYETKGDISGLEESDDILKRLLQRLERNTSGKLGTGKKGHGCGIPERNYVAGSHHNRQLPL